MSKYFLPERDIEKLKNLKYKQIRYITIANKQYAIMDTTTFESIAVRIQLKGYDFKPVEEFLE